MTDFTPPPSPGAPTINPLWLTLALPVIRMLLIATGSATAATADSQAGMILPALVAVATGCWSLWSWWQSHNKAIAINKLPAGSAVVK